MAIEKVNSTPVIAGAAVGAVAGGIGTWKGAPVIIKKIYRS